MSVIGKNLRELLKGQKWNYLLKIFTIFVCSVFFFGNNFLIFKQFVSHKTYYASKLNYADKLMLPNIAICNSSAFKNPKVSTLDLDDFLNNTLQFSESIVSITHGFAGNYEPSNIQKVLWNSTYRSKLFDIKPILSFYRGKCYIMSYKEEVFLILLIKFL